MVEEVNNFPNEIKNIIYSYIPDINKVFLNKDNYVKNHNIIRKNINKKKIEQYIRKTIIRDHAFVFREILKENIEKWIGLKNYYYRGCIFSNYLFFLKSFCIDNESEKCQIILINVMNKLCLTKNQYKKNHIRYIRLID
jgi:hypothetical protein